MLNLSASLGLAPDIRSSAGGFAPLRFGSLILADGPADLVLSITSLLNGVPPKCCEFFGA